MGSRGGDKNRGLEIFSKCPYCSKINKANIVFGIDGIPVYCKCGEIYFDDSYVQETGVYGDNHKEYDQYQVPPLEVGTEVFILVDGSRYLNRGKIVDKSYKHYRVGFQVF